MVMTQITMQKEILDTLTGLKAEVTHLKKDMHHLIEFIEDSRLTEEERTLLDKSVARIRSGNRSGFTSHQELKKELGL